MTSRVSTFALGLLLASPFAALAQTPVGSAFTYQGRLTDGATPANGAYDLEVRLFTAAAAGTQVGPTAARDDVLVTGGLFTMSLDFGPAAFAGSARWIEIAVRPGTSTGAYTTLTPRQELTPSPNAVWSTAAPWAGLAGVPAGFADGVDNDSGGTVTAVAAGTGLTGGTITTTGTLGVAFSGTGAAATVSRSDHNHDAAYASSSHNHLGQAWTGAGSPGLRLTVSGSGGIGLWGEANADSAVGVVGYSSASSGINYGVFGQTQSTIGTGTFGWSTASTGAGTGVYGRADGTGATGVIAEATATSGTATGLFAQTNSGFGYAIRAIANSPAGSARAVQADTSSPFGFGVLGRALNSTGSGIGVQGQALGATGSGVSGIASMTGPGASATGVVGTAAGNSGLGVLGEASATTGPTLGVSGLVSSPSGVGVRGVSQATGGQTYGVYGVTSSSAGRGVFGAAIATTGTSYGVYGSASSGFAGFFVGAVQVTGTLTKGGGAFKIDHPLDPENMYLYHSFVESPDMKNIYDGVVTTDGDGFATVAMPDWFEALNRDFRYQLTVIGDGAWARARVFRRIADGRFVIQTDLPAVEVSWQVTGIRHDPFAEKHRIPLEEPKPEMERGRYLHPDAWGRPPEDGVVEAPTGPEDPAAARP